MSKHIQAAALSLEKLPKLTTNMLAFQRSLEVSEAMLFGTVGADRTTAKVVEVVEKGVRGQSSHHDAKTKELKPGASNPQIVDVAMLPPGADTLMIRFGLTVLPNAVSASATDSGETATGLAAIVARYTLAGGFEELARRYVSNLANGRFAWRNRTTAAGGTVTLVWSDAGKEHAISFDALAFDLESIPSLENMRENLVNSDPALLERFLASFAGALAGTESPLRVNVAWFGRMQEYGEVYPSQEYVRDDSKGDKSRHLSSVRRIVDGSEIRAATIHSQKIGAALRCIDDWHGAEEYPGMPVPVNPYAGVQELNICLRDPKGTGKDFYSLCKKPSEIWNALVDGEVVPDAHFLVANLVRGGLFGAKND